MSNFMQFYDTDGINFLSETDTSSMSGSSSIVDYMKSGFGKFTKIKDNNMLNILLFILLLFIVFFYFYFMIYKKYKNYRVRRTRKITPQVNEINIEPVIEPVIDPNTLNTEFIDSKSFDFDIECDDSNCPDLACGDNEIILRKRDQCCPECVVIEGDTDSESSDYQARLQKLNKFVNKNISKIQFNPNLNDIGINTTKVTFSLIDRLTAFNYSNFNLEEFIKIFNREDEYIYIGIIFLFFGLLFLIFSK